jgi:formylglycine-generating enzyme required for sulfatase activity
MTRYLCIVLPAILESVFSFHVEDKKDPPKTFTNSIGMKFVWIPPGSFIMGSPKGEEGRELLRTNEAQHKVTLSKGFFMGVHTVTQEQWKKVMGKNPSRFKGTQNLPVENVSWLDCQDFIKELRAIDKKPYRLPFEAEWEYACRAGTTTPFSFGETISTDQANYNGEFTFGKGTKGVYRKKTMPVGSFPANAFGLYEMHGNVVQWCQDWYGEYRRQEAVNPQGPEKGELRVLRGGSWGGDPQSCRSAARGRLDPGRRDDVCGFRVCFFEQ